MSSFLWTAAIAGMYAQQLGLQDEDKSDLWSPRYYYHYQSRGSRVRESYSYTSLWPRSRGMSGDPSAAGFLGGQDAGDGGLYEPINFNEGGNARYYFIHGLCVDGSANPLGGATLELYLTSTDTIVSTGTTDSNGIYSLPTPYTGQNHKIYANYGPNTLVGGSVDTLQPVSSPW